MNPRPPVSASAPPPPPPSCFGACARCGREHRLEGGQARAYALEMMDEFESLGRLDYLVPEIEADPRLSFEHLFPTGTGNMFGVLEVLDARGETSFLRAFSSLRDGIRRVDGWVLPVLSQSMYDQTILPAQAEIKQLTSAMKVVGADGERYRQMEALRRARSQRLWDEMCRAYRFRNFRGEEKGLSEAVLPGTRLTGGMGECCAPKLLNHAVRNGLRPVGIAEFYWGANEGDGGRRSGHFYASCEARCQPLLGFLLCGLDSDAERAE